MKKLALSAILLLMPISASAGILKFSYKHGVKPVVKATKATGKFIYKVIY